MFNKFFTQHNWTHTQSTSTHKAPRHTHAHKEGDRQAIKEDVREKGMVEQGEQGRTEHKVHVKSMLLLTSITFSFTSPCLPRLRCLLLLPDKVFRLVVSPPIRVTAQRVFAFFTLLIPIVICVMK